ncbi:hypothetical protein F7734_10315 [Scytonema sp. UIC 10036]|uniref:DUF6731 family protein n=1 Tax=Scytonema sp. UIC 10036 TaxID=2304196 RepID=UPI0012DA6616|nr:DUF6731 family protein [Scytonema sp. UIC 10036]MUG92821.1 hypothetical protein [Scytonema sp. UIC 10036]
MSKNLTIDFYKVTVSEESNLSFNDILQKIITISIAQRSQEVRFQPVFLYEAKYGWEHTWEGEIVRLRMDNIPVKGNLAGTIEDFKLADDEGIGEQSAFIYHPATRILALQSNKHGVSPGNFAKYFELMIGSNTSIYLDPVLQLDAMQRFNKMNSVSKFHINIAALGNMSIFESSGLEEFANLTKVFQAPAINMELKVSRQKQSSLSVAKVRNAAESLLRISHQNSSQVKTVRISGSSDDNEHIFIDLLKDKMREYIKIQSSSKKRNIPYPERQIALRDAWKKRESEIFQMHEIC